MANPPPAPTRKKSGLGCFGCGCIILIILAVLALGLLGGCGYFIYHSLIGLTSPTATTIQTFDGGDDVYNAAEQKITAFNQSLQQNQPASLHLSADEINTVLARNPDIPRLNIHVFVTITGDQAGVQASFPGSLTPLSFLKDRYFNGDSTFGLNFDPDTRTVHVAIHGFKVGSQAIPDSELPIVESELNPVMNAQLQKEPALKHIVDHAKTIEIKDGEFVIETE